jgi:multidrug efflux pump subunit AcrB
VEGKMKDPRDFNKIIVARRANGPVYLDQVATGGGRRAGRAVDLAHQRPARRHHRHHQGAGRQRGGSGRRIQKVAADLKKTLPPDIKVEVLNDESLKVQSQLDNVKPSSKARC